VFPATWWFIIFRKHINLFVMKGLNKAYLCFVQDFISVKKPSHVVSRDGKTLIPAKQVKADKKKKK